MADSEDIDAPTPTPRAPRNGLGLLACVLALAALASSGYLHWQLVWRTGDDIDARFAELQANVAGERDERAAAEETARAERVRLAEDLAAQVQALATTRAALAARSTAGDTAPAPVTPRDWRLAEVEYLLRLANHRVRLERDAAGATDLLAAADEILARLDDFALHEVRALLAEETASLRAFEGADVAGVYLRLEAAKGLVDQLPLRLPEYVAADGYVGADAAPGAAPGAASGAASDAASDAARPEGQRSLVEALLARADGLVRFRRHDLEARRPLPAPDEAEDLERHLRTALDRAQLAALRRDQAIFAAGLSAARDALGAFVDPTRDAAVQLGAEIEALLTVDLAKPLPDISGSLTKLRDVRRVTVDNA